MTSASLELKQAAFDGDLDKVRSLVESGADVNATDQYGSGTLLNFHPGVTAYLLSKGADPNTQTNEFGASVLAGLCWAASDCANQQQQNENSTHATPPRKASALYC